MDFTGKVEVSASAETIFDRVTDLDTIGRAIRGKNVVLRRTGPTGRPTGQGDDVASGQTGLGTTWEADFMFRGKDRHMTALVTAFDRPEQVSFTGQTRSFDFLVTIYVVALAPERSRLQVTVNAKPRTLGARLLQQSAKIGRATLETRFQTRIEHWGRALSEPAQA